jgi:hypothetical protein
MAKRTDSHKKASCNKKRKQAINGETLRDAVVWAIDAKIFTNLRFHGNTSWQVLDRVYQGLSLVHLGNVRWIKYTGLPLSWSHGVAHGRLHSF